MNEDKRIITSPIHEINRKPIDALLVHTYWYDLEKPGHLDICNKLQILAACELFQKYNIKKIIIVGGNLFAGKAPIAVNIQKSIRKRLPESSRKFVQIFPTERTTLGEIRKFIELALSNNWHRLASLGMNVHIPRVKRGFSKIIARGDLKVIFFCSEEVLHSDKGLLKTYYKSQVYRLLAVNEQLAAKVEKLPILGNLILDIAGRYITHKGIFQPKLANFLLKFQDEF